MTGRRSVLALCLVVWAGPALALDPCDRNGELFVASDTTAERDVPKQGPIRVSLGASSMAGFSCVVVTAAGAVVDWSASVGCAAGSPSMVVRWRNDGTVRVTCDAPPPPPPPAPPEGGEATN